MDCGKWVQHYQKMPNSKLQTQAPKLGGWDAVWDDNHWAMIMKIPDLSIINDIIIV